MTKKRAEFVGKLTEAYQLMVAELEEADVKLLEKHLGVFNAYKELSNLIELGVDIVERRNEIKASGDSGYSSRLVLTFSTILGLSESTVWHITKSVEVFGGDYLRQLATDAQAQGIKLTNAHLRQLNRLDSPDWATDRQALIAQIFNGTLVTSRQVENAVNALLGVQTKQVAYADDDLNVPSNASKAKAKGDALDDLATSDDINVLCVQLVDLIQQVDKKFEKLGDKIRDWRADVKIETLQEMPMDSLDTASSAVTDFVCNVKDIGIVLDDVVKTVIATEAEAKT